MKTTVLLVTTCLAFASTYGQQPNCSPCQEGTRACLGNAANPDKTEQFATAADDADGLPLYWDVYVPQNPPPQGVHWPVVILVNAAGFEQGDRCSGIMPCMARDLTDNGFAVVSIDVRRDKEEGFLPCQVNAAFSPRFGTMSEVSDVRQAIRRGRNPLPTSILKNHVTGKVGAIGGSGGGAHVAWCAAFEETPGDKLDAAVCLSGAYDFGEQSSLEDPDPDNMFGFCGNVTDYCQVTIPEGGCSDLAGDSTLEAESPITKIIANGSNTAPVYAFATFEDDMPQGQFDRVEEILSGFNDGNKYKTREFHAKIDPEDPNMGLNRHSFSYWFDQTTANNNPNGTVCFLAKQFLGTYLGIDCSNCTPCTHSQ